MPSSIRWLGKRWAVNFALKSVQSKVKKIIGDLGTLRNIIVFSHELKLLFSSRSVYQTIIQTNVFQCVWTVIIATASIQTRRQKDQVKGHELHGVLPEKKMKKALLSESYYSVKVLILEMKSQSLWTVIQSQRVTMFLIPFLFTSMKLLLQKLSHRCRKSQQSQRADLSRPARICSVSAYSFLGPGLAMVSVQASKLCSCIWYY